ncbi:MAG: ATP-binding cassette domain-containing protein, partial [candidate division Zixibacteria bacterium]|nr:ATP-binding cassette domain-containing protein [candidate division Zixibacteria bacterium]
RGIVSLDRINKVMDTEPTVVSSNDSSNEKQFSKSIEFRDLSFSYNGKKDIHNINLTLEVGKSLGIIGPTASGKTTIVSLLARMFPVSKGAIFIDGVDINDWDIKQLRKQIGFVPQEPFLFSDTISQNILFYSNSENGDSAQTVTRAAAAAVIDNEINEFPDGYETILGERGITLSGGQKQRVAIARAIVTDPKIIILDDATSSVDTETEHKINQRLNDELKKRTAIVISHRISAVKDADLIIYLDKGHIVEQGTHDELITNAGQYKSLYKAQLIEEELKRM